MKRQLGAFTLGLAILLGLTLGPAVQTPAQAKTGLIMGVTLEPPHLDPTAGAPAAIDEIVYANVFEGLTRIDAQGQVKPGLAERWVIEDDGMTYRFILRPGVTFHDGAALEASDVKFSFERAVADDSENAQKGLFSAIDSIEAPDDKTVILKLNRKEGLLLWNLGWGDAVIVDPASAADNKTHPIGTGPFKFVDWTQGDQVRLTRNPDYWGTAAALDAATFKFIPDPAAQVAALLAGDVDVIPNIGAPEAVAQFQADPRFQVLVGTTEGETILAMNQRRPLLQDVRVRRAIQHAIDRQAVIDGAMFGFGTPIGSHFAPHSPAYTDLTGVTPYDPEKAKALLAEAGVAPGTKLVMKLPPPVYARRGGEVVAAQLQAVGFDVDQIPVDWGQWVSEVFKGDHDFDLTIVSHTEPLDIGIYARDDYYFGYDNPAFKELMLKIDGVSDPAQRNTLYKEAQRMLADDAVNGFLFQLAKVAVAKKELKGLWANAPIQANDLTGVKWE
ncbi:ABC transporter substrate-binding protein [Rhodospirillaceae bacterium KN72]|uniref:ABC transporter substrate-binding protein n=1 Tax=Pacificispira spongiicola TaxID=2729598 RepID=A0A7Y0E0R3_9PROT|nr:ABC transporter substrate-binding protein [Pacificispira spongiicola]NMM45086.1 ABC transporter substrate-binding protein [Pacificispira spongiicola]